LDLPRPRVSGIILGGVVVVVDKIPQKKKRAKEDQKGRNKALHDDSGRAQSTVISLLQSPS